MVHAVRGAAGRGRWVAAAVIACAFGHVPEARSAAVEPAALTIRADRGESVTRTLLVEGEGEVTAVVGAIAGADGGELPDGAIALATTRALPGLQQVVVGVGLAGAAAGAYTGELLIVREGATVRVPIHVDVRHRPWLPLAVLLAGVAAGLALTGYQRAGQHRDALLVRLGQLPPADELPEAWRRHLADLRARAEFRLREQRWADAQAHVAAAEACWLAWTTDRAAWLRLVEYAEGLRRELGGDEEPRAFPRKLRARLDDLIEGLPTRARAGEARDELARVRRVIQALREADAALAAARPEAGTQAAELRLMLRRVADLELDDTGDTAVTMLQGIATAALAMKAQAPAGGPEFVRFDAAPADTMRGPAAIDLPPVVPEALPTAKDAGRNLRRFAAATRVSTALLLASAGFFQLYASAPTFGDDPWADYLALLAWGLFAEGTRDSLARSLERLRGVA